MSLNLPNFSTDHCVPWFYCPLSKSHHQIMPRVIKNIISLRPRYPSSTLPSLVRGRSSLRAREPVVRASANGSMQNNKLYSGILSRLIRHSRCCSGAQRRLLTTDSSHPSLHASSSDIHIRDQRRIQPQHTKQPIQHLIFALHSRQGVSNILSLVDAPRRTICNTCTIFATIYSSNGY